MFFSSALFSVDLKKYDPYQIRLGTRIIPPSEFFKYIYDRLKIAKKNNKYVLANFEELKKRKSFDEIDDALLISDECVRNKWEKIHYRKIKFINKSSNDGDCIAFFKDGKWYYIKLYYKSVVRLAATVIAKAKYQKTGVQLNLAALTSKGRQKYLNHNQLMHAIEKRRESMDIEDMPIFFHRI